MIKIITFLVIVVPALIFGFMGKITEMGLAVVIGAIAGAFLNLDKFERFKGAGFEAEMKKVEKAVNEAYATINDMKEVSRPLILTLISNLTFGGRWGGAPENENEKYTGKLIELSKSLGIFEGEIQKAIDMYHHQNIWDRYDEIIKLTNKLHIPIDKMGTELRIKLSELSDRSSTSYPTETQIRDIFKTVVIHQEYALTQYEEAIQDYLYYLKNKKPRRIGG